MKKSLTSNCLLKLTNALEFKKTDEFNTFLTTKIFFELLLRLMQSNYY